MTTGHPIVGLFICHLAKVCHNNGVMKTLIDFKITCSVPVNVSCTITKHISIRMVIFLLSYMKAFIMRYLTTCQKRLQNRGLQCLAAFGNRIGCHGVFISNVTCVCVMYIFSLTGVTGFKDFGLWRKLWLCSVNSGML